MRNHWASVFILSGCIIALTSCNRGTPPKEGWLYTQNNQIYISSPGSPDTVWMGRGVNMDDIFFGGYNSTLWMDNPDQTLEQVAATLIDKWKPNFIRISLGMNSYTPVSWTDNTENYATQMTNVINFITTTYPAVFVLVTLRSDLTMIDEDTVDGDAEATGLPSAATDATYVALVDAFADKSNILFGISNEPGGDLLTDADIAAAMSHAVGVIRAEEKRLGVPSHLVSVQGNNWTSDLSNYVTNPIAYDNVIYEIHYYPGLGVDSTAYSSYSGTLPMIIGEYGNFKAIGSGSQANFYKDMETGQIPNLAWVIEPYTAVDYDLLKVTKKPTNFRLTAWGRSVRCYLLSH